MQRWIWNLELPINGFNFQKVNLLIESWGVRLTCLDSNYFPAKNKLVFCCSSVGIFSDFLPLLTFLSKINYSPTSNFQLSSSDFGLQTFHHFLIISQLKKGSFSAVRVLAYFHGNWANLYGQIQIKSFKGCQGKWSLFDVKSIRKLSWVILIFSGQKTCTRIIKTISHSFLHFSRDIDVINYL